MNKEVVKKILQNKKISEQEFLTFITDYIEDCGKQVSSEQLIGIVQAIKMNLFNIQFAAEQAALKMGLLITKTLDKNGRVLKVDIRDEFRCNDTLNKKQK